MKICLKPAEDFFRRCVLAMSVAFVFCLVVAGRLDAKYVELAERMADAIGSNASLVVIDGAGHACHLEKPDEFVAAVVPFLSEPVGG